MTTIILTVREIFDLAKATGFIIQEPVSPIDDDDMEIEYTILESEGGVTIKDDDGTPRIYAHGAYITEYPEEGIYPLGNEKGKECTCQHPQSSHWHDLGHCQSAGCECQRFSAAKQPEPEPEPEWTYDVMHATFLKRGQPVLACTILATLNRPDGKDTERLDWLEKHPDMLRHCTWVNANLGRLFNFIDGITCGECQQTLRAAIDAAMQAPSAAPATPQCTCKPKLLGSMTNCPVHGLSTAPATDLYVTEPYERVFHMDPVPATCTLCGKRCDDGLCSDCVERPPVQCSNHFSDGSKIFPNRDCCDPAPATPDPAGATPDDERGISEWSNAELVAAIKQLTAERDDAMASLKQVTPLKNSDIRLVIRLTEEAQALRAELAAYSLTPGQVADWRDARDRVFAERNALREERDKLRAEIDRVAKERDEASAHASKSLDALGERDKHCFGLQNTLNQITDALLSAETERDSLRAERDRLAEQLALGTPTITEDGKRKELRDVVIERDAERGTVADLHAILKAKDDALRSGLRRFTNHQHLISGRPCVKCEALDQMRAALALSAEVGT